MKFFAYWVLCSSSSYHHVWKLYLVREFESEYEGVCYRDKSESLKGEDEVVKGSDQGQWGWARMSDRKEGFHSNWLTENLTKHTDKSDISHVEWAKEESYLNSW